MISSEVSFRVPEAATSQALAISSVSAVSALIGSGSAVVTPTVDCFVRNGAAPVAVANTDLFLLGGSSYRLEFPLSRKLAFVTGSATGTVYITPDA